MIALKELKSFQKAKNRFSTVRFNKKKEEAAATITKLEEDLSGKFSPLEG